MREKIAELKEKYTLLKGVVVKDESDTHSVWLVVGNQQFVLDGYHSIEEGEWMREMLAKAILTLIAEEQKPMREALEEARKDLVLIQGGDGPYNRDPLKHLENCYKHMIETAGEALAKIDAVLGGKP
jgi:hypothetical protein